MVDATVRNGLGRGIYRDIYAEVRMGGRCVGWGGMGNIALAPYPALYSVLNPALWRCVGWGGIGNIALALYPALYSALN